MPKPAVFRELAEKWAKNTFNEAEKSFPDLSPRAKEVLKELDLYGKIVNGNSVEGLGRHVKAELHISPRFFTLTRIFHSLLGDGIPHPIQFISKICNNYSDYLVERPEYADMVPAWGICARGMRTVASFYREQDFKERIGSSIDANIGSYELVQDPEEDTRGHADLIVKVKGLEFRIWLFQLTERGIVNTTDRLLGNRGELRKGIHIICGHDTTNESQTETIEGWNLYSDSLLSSCIEKMQQVIENKENAKKYSEITDILKAPKELLSTTTTFIVE